MNAATAIRVPQAAEKVVPIDAEAAQEGLIMTTTALAEEASGEMTKEVFDQIEKLLMQAATDLAKCRVAYRGT